MIDPLIDPASRDGALRRVYDRLRFAQSCAVVGLNDIGKTALLSLAQYPSVVERYWLDAGHGAGHAHPLFVRVDCNLLSGATEGDLYAVLAEATDRAARRAGVALGAATRRQELGTPPVMAAVALEALQATLIEDNDRSLVYLFDEFDTFYRDASARAVLALRAFDNRLGPRLAYVVAVERALRAIRPPDAPSTAEFEELFVGGTFTLPPLDAQHARDFVARYVESRRMPVAAWVPQSLADLSGGHPGMLWACVAALAHVVLPSATGAARALLDASEVRSECENVWSRVYDESRDAALAIPLVRLFVQERHTEQPARPDGLHLDGETGTITMNGRPLAQPLGATEFRLLQTLASRPGALVTKDEVARAVWPDEEHMRGVDDARIDKLVDRVRGKIEPDRKSPRYLVTVRGLGYRLLPQGDPQAN